MNQIPEQRGGLVEEYAGATLARATGSVYDLLFTLPILLICLLSLARHVFWRDELNAFGIVWASPSIRSLFWHVHYEGHPWLWYGLLWLPSRISQSLLVPKILQAVIVTAIYLVVSLRSPFSRMEKVLILLGYFFLFEYTVLTRMYGVLLLLLVVYCWQRVSHPQRYASNGVLLGLIASTDTLGVIISGALLLEALIAAVGHKGLKCHMQQRRLLLLPAMYAVVTGFAVWSLVPVKDVSTRTTGKLFEYAGSLSHLGFVLREYIERPIIPMASPSAPFTWSPVFHTYLGLHLLLAGVVLGCYWYIFRRHTNLLILVFLNILGLCVFGQVIYEGSMRHWGYTFLGFIAALWIYRSHARRLPAVAYVLLALNACAGISAVAKTWSHPFSESKATAEWLHEHGKDTLPLAGTPDTSVMGVAQYLHRPIYMLECSCYDTFVLFSKRRDHYDDDRPGQIAERILAARDGALKSPFILLTVEPLSSTDENELSGSNKRVDLLASFQDAIATKENFNVYQVSDAPETK